MYTPQVYILGSGAIFQYVLEGLQQIFDPTAGVSAWAGGSGPFPVGVLIQLAAILGIMILSAKSVVSQRLEAHHALLALGVYLFLFIPTTSVNITNVYNGNTRTVDGVPIGIAYPAGFVSTLSYDMMNVIQQVDNFGGQAQPLLMSNTGYVGPLKQLVALRSFPQAVKQIDPNLYCSFTAFVQNCVAGYSGFNLQNMVNDTASSPNSPSPSIQNNLLNYYDSSNNTRYYNDQYPSTGGCNGGTEISCAQADANLSQDLSNFFSNSQSTSDPDLDDVLSDLTNSSGGFDLSNNGGPTNNIETSLDQDFQQCDVGATGAATTCQASNEGLTFMENELAGCVAHMGIIGQSVPEAERAIAVETLPAFCTTMTGALAHQQVRNAGMASMFEANVIPLMTIFQFLFFALAPLMAVVMVFYGPMGPKIYMKYIMFGIWSQSFLPIAALMNNYAQYQANDAFQHLLSGYLGAQNYSGVTNPAILTNFSNMPEVFSYGAKTLSMADFMITLTPVIAAVVLTGSYFALTTAASSISANDSLNKSEDVATPNLGATNFNQSATGYGVQNTGHGLVNATNLTADAAPTVEISSLLSRSAAASQATANAATFAASNSSSQAVSLTRSAIQQLVDSNSITHQQAAQFNTKMDEMQNSAETFAKAITSNVAVQHQIETLLQNSAMAGLSAKVVGAELKSILSKTNSLTNTTQQNHAIQEASQTMSSIGHGVSTILSTIGSESITSNDSQNIQKALADSNTQLAQATEATSKTAQFQQAASQVEQSGTKLALNANAVMNLLSQGGGYALRLSNFENDLSKSDPTGQTLARFKQLRSMFKSQNPNTSNLLASAEAMTSLMAQNSNPEVTKAFFDAIQDPAMNGAAIARLQSAAQQQLTTTKEKTANNLNDQNVAGYAAKLNVDPSTAIAAGDNAPTPGQVMAATGDAGEVVDPPPAVAAAEQDYIQANANGGVFKNPNTPGAMLVNQMLAAQRRQYEQLVNKPIILQNTKPNSSYSPEAVIAGKLFQFGTTTSEIGKSRMPPIRIHDGKAYISNMNGTWSPLNVKVVNIGNAKNQQKPGNVTWSP